jgi:hypothetical protein
MESVFRVWGAPGLNDGVRLLAESELEAVQAVAEIFTLEEATLKAAPDKSGDLAARGVLLFGKGHEADLMPQPAGH